ncbi:MAG: peptidylprolyl isomerase [Candidatus Dormibacteraeota bacterium]|nr:peptidylprolyl isomerase [Candidatus Dormibacteraeota bacterium]
MRRVLASSALAALCACGSVDQGAALTSPAPGCDNDIRTCMEQRTTPPPTVIDPAKKYTATVHTNRGDFVISFVDPKVAPQTVNNFVYLAQNHYYDGLTFHRVVAGFVVQGGDPLGNGTGGPAYKLPDETNPSTWPRGTAGMASSQAGVSGSQFFITLGDAPFLATGGIYNHFGQVTSGMEVIDAIKVGDKMTSIDITAS